LRYSRQHIRKYWAFQNRRLFGFSFIVFAAMYSIAMLSTFVFTQLFLISPVKILLLWIVIFLVGTFAIVGGAINAHLNTVRIMNEAEYIRHSKNVGYLMIAMVVASLLFTLPILVFSNLAMLMLLFTIGGILFILYFMLFLIFGHHYHEIALSALFMWIVFVIGILFMGKMYYSNILAFQVLSLLLSSATIITVFSIMGLGMLYGASNEFVKEFKTVYKVK